MAAVTYKNQASDKPTAEEERRARERELARQQRRDMDIHAQFTKDAADVLLDKPRFKLTLIEKVGKRRAMYSNVSKFVESFDWTDEGEGMTGTIVFRAPDDVLGVERPKVEDGDQVRCEVLWNGRFRYIWQMRIYVPDEQLGEGIVNFELRDDMHLMRMGSDSYDYKKRKKGKYKNGYKPHDIAKLVCTDNRIRIGKLEKGSTTTKSLRMDQVPPLAPILRAYKKERDQTGKRFVFRFEQGEFSVTKLRRQPMLYKLGSQVMEASSGHDRGERFITAVTVMGNIEDDKSSKQKDRKKKPIEVTVVDKDAVKQYGYIQGTLKVGADVESKQELKERGEQHLRRMMATKLLDKIQLTHPGIPFIRKGDAVDIQLPEYGFKNRKRRPVKVFKGGSTDILFVKRAWHSVVGTDYTMDLEFGLTDPVAEMKRDIREARDERRREEKREERDGKKK